MKIIISMSIWVLPSRSWFSWSVGFFWIWFLRSSCSPFLFVCRYYLILFSRGNIIKKNYSRPYTIKIWWQLKEHSIEKSINFNSIYRVPSKFFQSNCTKIRCAERTKSLKYTEFLNEKRKEKMGLLNVWFHLFNFIM